MNAVFTTALLLIVFVIVGSTLLGFPLYWVWKSIQTTRWLTATGVVTESWLKERRVRSGKVYQLIVRYEYAVDGVRYRSQRLFFGDVWSGSQRRSAEDKRYHYKPGMAVMAHYNPDKPEEAVLEPGINGSLYWMVGVGAFFLTTSLVIGVTILIATIHDCGLIPNQPPPRGYIPKWCNNRSF